MDYSKIITIEPGKRSGKPCIRGMRITVQDVLEYLAGGMTEDDVLRDFPELRVTTLRPAWPLQPTANASYLSRQREAVTRRKFV